MLWRIDPLLRGDSVINCRFWETAGQTLSRSATIAVQQRGKQASTSIQGCFLHASYRGVILKTIETTQLVDKNSTREALKIEPERVKLKNLHCLQPLPGND
jgi:hypothetical protein